ncbi:autotransporter domain-containing protein [Aureimonas jatrophae]|uniref:Outer membrane lipase/esterase n=1 Tax=Aureimonas jatrophae TaxID=1166073 RepID=A0A1H0CGJ8_9HYPH|nr:autotransporter domain-containing protein [Aureimonas jatrophae]MBB3949225.1 outer membrane lipase/esterase [Aureimonas jatrophae]SDN57007.1 outer membrane lipase/esterase [Aureimonas jatrophae]
MSRLKSRAVLSATAALLLGATAMPALAQVAGPVISFGDSLSDNGNLFLISGTPTSPPYFAGRFSNGPVFTEYLNGDPMQPAGAATLGGIRINPERSQNYAFGGARTDRLDGLRPPGIPAQIDAFLLQDGRFGANDVVTLYGGANNIFQEVNVPGATPATIGAEAVASAGDIAASLARLGNLGAPTVVVLNLPDIGATPRFAATLQGSVVGTLATDAFNTALQAGVTQVAATLPNTDVVLVDVRRLGALIASDPARFGILNTRDACVETPACATAPASVQNTYQYWDSVHPTTGVHRLFSQLVEDYLSVGTSAAAVGSLTETALLDRMTANDAVRERARLAALRVPPPATGSDAAIAVPFSDVYVTLGGSRFERDRGNDYRFDNGTVRIGLDHRMNDRLLVGGALSASTGEVDDARLTYDTRSFAADLYATALFGPAYVTLSGGVAHQDYEDLDRRTLVDTVVNRGTDSNGVSANVGLEAGYGFRTGALTVTPALGLDYLYADADGYAETGAAAQIVTGDTQRNALLGSANLHLAYTTDLGGRPVALTGRIGYEDILTEDDARVSARIAGGISRARSAELEDLAARGFVAGVGVDAGLSDRLSLTGRYSVGTSSDIDVSHVGEVGLKLRF